MSRSKLAGQTGTRPEKQAIFYQRSKSLQNEFALINLVTMREAVRTKLEKLIKDIKYEVRVCDQPCMTELFNLITGVREATYDLVDSVAIWQQGFTQNIRPQLLNIDYLVDMITSMEFVSATHLRREFRFQLGSGNFMLLPLPTVGKTQKPYKVAKDLAEALHNFANPTEHRLVKCYQILLNCMTKEQFKKIMNIDYWMQNRWKPNIQIIGWAPKPKEEKLDLLAILLRGDLPSASQTNHAIAASQDAPSSDSTQLLDRSGTVNSGQGSRKVSVFLPTEKSNIGASPSSSPLRPTRILEVPVPGGSVLTFEKKTDVFSPGVGDAESLLLDMYAPSRQSPLRPSRVARVESPAGRKRQCAMARAIEENRTLEIFSDDSEDERIKKAARAKKMPIYKRPDYEEEQTSPGRVRREKALAEAKTIEEKAARMSINTSILRETWLGVPTSEAVERK